MTFCSLCWWQIICYHHHFWQWYYCSVSIIIMIHSHQEHTHTHLTAFFPGLPRWAGTRKVKPIWILLKQETVGGSGISWAICKSASCSRQITSRAPHRSSFLQDALPATETTASKHWRQEMHIKSTNYSISSTGNKGQLRTTLSLTNNNSSKSNTEALCCVEICELT